jgi:predicted small lipoprotein YifL
MTMRSRKAEFDQMTPITRLAALAGCGKMDDVT